MERVIELIAQSTVLAVLSEREQSMLGQWAIQRHFEKGEFVAHYGDIWPYLAIVGSGAIKVIKLSPDGRSLGALRLQPGEEFWSPSLFDGGPLPAALEVSEASTVFLWNRDHVLPTVQKNNQALWELCLMLMHRMRQASGFVEELTFLPVSGRLARLLINKFNHHNDDLVARDLSLDEMSTMIGTTPVMVCKLINRFAEDGLIKVSRTEFQLTDQPGLEEIAGPR
jgi:CRP/FNR family transcriptional regulator